MTSSSDTASSPGVHYPVGRVSGWYLVGHDDDSFDILKTSRLHTPPHSLHFCRSRCTATKDELDEEQSLVRFTLAQDANPAAYALAAKAFTTRLDRTKELLYQTKIMKKMLCKKIVRETIFDLAWERIYSKLLVEDMEIKLKIKWDKNGHYSQTKEWVKKKAATDIIDVILNAVFEQADKKEQLQRQQQKLHATQQLESARRSKSVKLSQAHYATINPSHFTPSAHVIKFQKTETSFSQTLKTSNTKAAGKSPVPAKSPTTTTSTAINKATSSGPGATSVSPRGKTGITTSSLLLSSLATK